MQHFLLTLYRRSLDTHEFSHALMQPDRLRTELLELILNFTGLIRVGVKRAKLFCTVEFPAYISSSTLFLLCLETFLSDDEPT
jgi:hypothetical protein